MITIKEKLMGAHHFRVSYICPACGIETMVMSNTYFCNICYKSIVDIKMILDSEFYALKYHFGRIREFS